MASFLSTLFGKAKDGVSLGSNGLAQRVPESRKQSGRREPPSELDWSIAEYIPLPPSPPTWEVDGRDEFNREYNNPTIGPVLQAEFKNQHAKAVKLAVDLSAEQRQGRVGDVIAKAYRKLIVQRMKTGQLAAAAKQCVEMFEAVPSEVQDVDRRRFNRILKHMDKAGKKHSYTPVDPATRRRAPSSQSRKTLDGLSSENVSCRAMSALIRPLMSLLWTDRERGCSTDLGPAPASRR